jgi:two-component system, cell cycle response regulator
VATRVRERLSAELEDLEQHRAIDVEERLHRAQRLERAAHVARLHDLEMRATLVQADMLLRRGETGKGARFANEVNRWAAAHGPNHLLARSHLVLSSTYEVIGDSATCLDHALRAVELLDPSTPPRVRGNFVMRLGDALSMANSHDAARQRYQDAARIFIAIGDVERHLSLLNNLAYAEFEAGDEQAAWRTAEQMRTLADQSGIPLNPEFLETLARAQIGLGKFILAENSLLAALERLSQEGDVQPSTPAQLLLTLAEVQRHQKRLAAAQDTLDACLAICVERELVGIRVEALREQAELHAANGRFQLAYRLHKTYHEEAINLSTLQQEARARTRQAMLETTEARSEARRFWEQARTDPLTGLKNRRYVDEELPRLLAERSRTGLALCVAILDADRFKRINDTFTHDVGDRVIRSIAALLREGIVDAPRSSGAANLGFAARLGGEEYLLVLTGVDLPAAAELLEALRRGVAEHSWTALTGSLPVTVSGGLTEARDGDTQSSILRRADRGLYAAKAAGRNQVVTVDPRDGASLPGPGGEPGGGFVEGRDGEPAIEESWAGGGAPASGYVSEPPSRSHARRARTSPRIGRDGDDATITPWPAVEFRSGGARND